MSDHRERIEAYRRSYRDMLGFVPPRVAARFAQLETEDPELLLAQEALRARVVYTDELDQKTVQLILFAILASKLSDAAKLHGLAARRAGASDAELRAAIALAALFSGVSVNNRGPSLMADIDALEERSGA
ncbi:carboxymuconolactone decarboxylase family protein [Leucobacter sp. CSA1]|uniref:Carboxymuconolactone decarboxylase family protein n=1 Tax=Leucobacter chromiisoli TaxID=2796471 RepID=A0A934UUX9_9MICO|nr:carboxymuconolactone decarboxylase family protein [Leucobacter chromiisoli]MBK0418896.1 carboxymuconolactone decarboxylase family protein [Leucobacter chromiisoli]